jgi:hypothetical protein
VPVRTGTSPAQSRTASEKGVALYGSKPRSVDLELILENAHAVLQFVPAEEFFRKVIEKARPYTMKNWVTGFETMLDRKQLGNTLRTILLSKRL